MGTNTELHDPAAELTPGDAAGLNEARFPHPALRDDDTTPLLAKWITNFPTADGGSRPARRTDVPAIWALIDLRIDPSDVTYPAADVWEATLQHGGATTATPAESASGPTALMIWAISTSPTSPNRSMLLRRQNCPLSILEHWAASNDVHARAAVAANPHIPSELALYLLVKQCRAVAAVAAANPQLPAAAIERAFESGDADLRVAAARNPNCPPRLLRRAVRVGGPARTAAISNPNCPDRLAAREKRVDEHRTILDYVGRALSRIAAPVAWVGRQVYKLSPFWRLRRWWRGPASPRLERILESIKFGYVLLVAFCVISVVMHLIAVGILDLLRKN